MGLYTGHHLAGAEGLCDIIVGSQAQTADLVDVVLLGRHHNDWGVLIFPDPLADLKAVHAGQHQIQDEKIKFLLQGPLKPGFPVVFDLHLKARKLQIILLQLRNALFVFYDQNSAHNLLLLHACLPQYKMDLCADPFFTGGPDPASMVLHDLLYDGKSDAASSLG